jgi:predicted ATP-dependent serine protease
MRANPEPGPHSAGRTLAAAISAHDSQLVGRKRELTAVSRALERLGGRQPALVEVAGEPGIGKTRLLGELDGKRSGVGSWCAAGVRRS